ncbi:hypothetical protein BT93_C1908 [Corymbia citriodora subsp. variegata]|nr:hypothetical protein BT93_C1908 [Corymbia citriodora subsp. variegata]
MEVGFLGLGIMGKAMAMNLIKHGFKVTVWNRTLSKVLSLSLSHRLCCESLTTLLLPVILRVSSS